jgi:hypothetical protein
MFFIFPLVFKVNIHTDSLGLPKGTVEAPYVFCTYKHNPKTYIQYYLQFFFTFKEKRTVTTPSHYTLNFFYWFQKLVDICYSIKRLVVKPEGSASMTLTAMFHIIQGEHHPPSTVIMYFCMTQAIVELS